MHVKDLSLFLRTSIFNEYLIPYTLSALTERFSQVIGTQLKKLHMIYGREDSTVFVFSKL